MRLTRSDFLKADWEDSGVSFYKTYEQYFIEAYFDTLGNVQVQQGFYRGSIKQLVLNVDEFVTIEEIENTAKNMHLAVVGV